MKTLFLLPLLASALFMSALHAQDAADTVEALQQKLERQEQVIAGLQNRLETCRDNATDTDSSETLSNRYQFQPATSPSAPRRNVGVYQQPSEPKLACADYSAYYFSRHPAMAAVCGASARPAAVPDEPAAQPPSTTPLPQHP